jgi:hypothetical protein
MALYRECECREALEAMAGFGMTGLVPTKLEQEIGRNDAVSTITARSEARGAAYRAGRRLWSRRSLVRAREAVRGVRAIADCGRSIDAPGSRYSVCRIRSGVGIDEH